MSVAPQDTQATVALGPVRRSPTIVLRHSLAFCRRNLVQMKNEPVWLLASSLMPVLLSLLFIFGLGGALSSNRSDYMQYLLPGIMVQTASMAARSTGLELNLDFTTGLMDRFRSLPVARSSVLIGRIGADLVRMALGQVVMFGYALAIGFRPGGGIGGVLLGVLVIMSFGFALSWVSAYIGLVVRAPQVMQQVGFIWMMPLQFGSSMFVAPETMPGWLRQFAEVNPVSLVCDASRDLMLGTGNGWSSLGAFGWICALLVVFGPLAVAQYHRRL